MNSLWIVAQILGVARPKNKNGEKQNFRQANKKKKFWNLTISELFFKTGFSRFGGDKRDRTADLLNAIQALSQLSYTPILRPRLQTAFAL